MASIVHIVLFKMKPDASAEAVGTLCKHMIGLKEQCLLPETGKPYIKSVVGGKDNSIESFQQGMTHAFVFEFESVAHRDYYIQKDPAHAALTKGDAGCVGGATVVDFTPGVF